MTLFKNTQINYAMLAPHVGKRATVSLYGGKTYHGEIVAVRQDGILFHSDNPGFLFLPFLAVAALALTVPLAFGVGYGAGRRAYGPYPYPYPSPYYY
ncbi:MAG: hypothetical protein AWM53_00140 [Candidatus Dichloromethanomonas elyunquensis]|nr:MAG: hypothetical protein AWM53_00140 [Candidatus Dichloromethanomonas elyunquensis]